MAIERERIRAVLSAKGFRQKSNDHQFYYLFVGEKKTSVFTKISHGNQYKDYSDELVQYVYHQMGLVKKELLEFIDCPLSYENYIALLKQRGRIK